MINLELSQEEFNKMIPFVNKNSREYFVGIENMIKEVDKIEVISLDYLENDRIYEKNKIDIPSIKNNNNKDKEKCIDFIDKIKSFANYKCGKEANNIHEQFFLNEYNTSLSVSEFDNVISLIIRKSKEIPINNEELAKLMLEFELLGNLYLENHQNYETLSKNQPILNISVKEKREKSKKAYKKFAYDIEYEYGDEADSILRKIGFEMLSDKKKNKGKEIKDPKNE